MVLKEKTAVVTGASGGIGAAVARELAREGVRVCLWARSEGKLARLVEEIEGLGGEARYQTVDVSQTQAVREAADQLEGTGWSPDILINNAGIGRWLYLDETPWPDLDRFSEVPYLATLYATRAFLPGMLQRKVGLLVNLNSPVCFFPWPGATVYAGARGAIRTFSAALQQDLAGTGVGCLHFVPGKVESDYFMNNPGSEERVPAIDRLVRTLTPEDVAHKLVKSIKRNRREVIFPFLVRLTVWQGRLFPRLTAWIVRKTGHKRIN